ncbi:hypothetical protein HGRIS_012840 [Hohenbuehelia grisea]|uniref:RING-type domain-containing protein n=1 Tax=Hohenbuehelia grisea TaxID=104357 RepID=A0ABR3ITU2_9AGAR
MSDAPNAPPEFDFWQFVSCAKCQLPYGYESGQGPTAPFWLTECGHVICNHHLNADQSCAQCGAQNIQLAPLQPDLEAPMSAWFSSIPSALESATFAARFQLESMAAQVRFFKEKTYHYRSMVEKLRREIFDLKRANEALTQHHHNQRDQPHRHHPDQEPSGNINSNGKRRMMDAARSNHSSSPRYIKTPSGPGRLTLPPGQQPPKLAAGKDQSSYNHEMHSRDPNASSHDRPGSQRYTAQYAYAPQFVSPDRPPVVYGRSNAAQSSRNQPHNQEALNRPSSFKPAPSGSMDLGGRPGTHIHVGERIQKAPTNDNLRPQAMAPPPVPQRRTDISGGGNRTRVSSTANGQFHGVQPGSRSFQQDQSLKIFKPQGPTQRFTPRNASEYQAPFTSSRGHPSTSGGQRVPFVPGQT